MASITQQAAEEFLQKLLAEMSPENEQFMMQLLAENKPAAGPLRKVVQNILDKPVPQRLSKPLLPGQKTNHTSKEEKGNKKAGNIERV